MPTSKVWLVGSRCRVQVDNNSARLANQISNCCRPVSSVSQPASQPASSAYQALVFSGGGRGRPVVVIHCALLHVQYVVVAVINSCP